MQKNNILIRKSTIKDILKTLKEIRLDSTMKRAGFGSVIGENAPYPKNEHEVTTFIKKRTKVWREAWLIEPLDKIIKQLENELL